MSDVSKYLSFDRTKHLLLDGKELSPEQGATGKSPIKCWTSVLGWAGLAAWSWLLTSRGGFWRSGPVLPAAVRTRRVRVTAVLPARDEAESIVGALHSLLAQRFEGELRVVLVDDGSQDGTGELARALSRQDERLQVIDGLPLAEGWTGKLWAVSQGLAEASAREADYVLLTDADIVHGPGHVAALVAKAEMDGLDLVSEMVRLHCESFAERAMIPAFVFFFGMLYPFRWVGDRRRTTAAAAGGTMLVAQRALDRVGGVSRIPGALIDDVALAREVKRGGHAIWLGHATQAVSARAYPGFADVWEMVARTAYVQLDYSPWKLAGTAAGLLGVYAGPVLAACFGRRRTRWLGVGAWAMMAVAFQPTLRRYRRSPAWGVALPAIACFYLAATFGSAARFYRGTGGRWKRRVYAPRSDGWAGQG